MPFLSCLLQETIFPSDTACAPPVLQRGKEIYATKMGRFGSAQVCAIVGVDVCAAAGCTQLFVSVFEVLL